MTTDSIYDDKFVTVTKKHIIIKWYYFPTAQSKSVEFAQIQGVYYSEHKCSLLTAKHWGQAITKAW
jgi:hypothetical protein